MVHSNDHKVQFILSSIPVRVLTQVMQADKLFFNVDLFLRQRRRGVGAKRGGQKIQSGLCTDSSKPDMGLELTNHEIMT